MVDPAGFADPIPASGRVKAARVQIRNHVTPVVSDGEWLDGFLLRLQELESAVYEMGWKAHG